MNSLFVLLKVQFLSLFGINKIVNKKKGKVVGLSGLFGTAVILLAVVAVVAYVYSKMFAEMYVAMDSTKDFIPTIFACVSIICLVFSFYSSSNNVYGGKDFDLLNAMPIKTHIIVISKLAYMYLADLLFAVLILVPAVVVHFELIGAIATVDIVRLFLMALFLPVFPTIISLILGAFVSLISTRFKRKALIQSLLYGFVFVGSYAISFIDTNLIDTLAPIRKMYVLLPLVVEGISSFSYTALFCGVNLIVFALALLVVVKTYNPINTMLKSVKRSKNFKLGVYAQKGQFKVLLKKEFRLLFSAPIYAMNTLMGSVMAIIGSIALLIFGIKMNSLQVSMTFAVLLQALFAFSLMISPTTAVSISVEGNTFYLMRTMPISTKKLLNTKLFVNILVGAIPALIGSVVFSFALKGASVWFILLFILNCVLYSVLGGNVGLLFNLLFPMLKWENITKAVKQGVSLVLTVLVGMAIAGGVFCILYFVKLDLEILLLLIFAFLFILSLLTYWLIMKYGERLIREKT